MSARPSTFRFGTFVVRVSECLFLTEEPCVPPSCSYLTVCKPPYRTLARIAYIPRLTDVAEFRRLLQEVQRLNMDVEVVVGDPMSPQGLAMSPVEVLQRDLGR